MIYLPKQKTKIYLIILCGLITLNVIFISSKSYNAHLDAYDYAIGNASEMQYQICLSSLPYNWQREFINNTRIEYFLNLPEETLLFIYFGYFLIATGFILSSKFKLNDSTDEK